MTGLPMVFAVWAARAGLPQQDPAPFLASLRFGMDAHRRHRRTRSTPKLASPKTWRATILRATSSLNWATANTLGLKTFLQYASELRSPTGDQRKFRHDDARRKRSTCITATILIGIGMAADAVRRKLHPHGIVSYIIDRNINYTNFCTEYCSFCAFYRPMGHAEGYVHPKEVIFEKIQETIDLGGTGILMQGGLHPELKIEWYEDLLRSIKQRFGDKIWCHCFSAPEIVNIAEVSGLTLRDTIARLRDAGLESIPGGGAEILDDEVRHRISRLEIVRRRIGSTCIAPPTRSACAPPRP